MSLSTQQKLEYIIKLAEKRGWKPSSVGMATIIPVGWIQHDHYKGIIFNHEFARALWPIDGKKKILNIRKGKSFLATPHTPTKNSWQYHLQQAVISEDPINYIYESIKE